MRIALFFPLCEGEYEIARNSIERLVEVCPQHQFDLYVVDDGSPSEVGRRLIAEDSEKFGFAELVQLPKSLGFWGTCTRMMIGFRQILSARRNYDFVLRMDADLFPVRFDLGAEVDRVCVDRSAFYGCMFDLRARDAVLVLSDLFPAGFRRKCTDGVMSRDWVLNRWGRTWWDDIGFSALRNGYRFRAAGGSFMMLGFDALQRIDQSGVFSRDDSKFGLHAADDSLLTIVCHGLDIPVVDFGEQSPSWQGVLSFGAETPWELVEQVRPFVVHPLKNTGPGWRRRKELSQRLSGGKSLAPLAESNLQSGH